ncbi:MAG: hypothetical protein NTV80_05210 [Verrucomicrobia bacterium]|nr:hypothetical protein [Verrucomicrobiota bacterium]
MMRAPHVLQTLVCCALAMMGTALCQTANEENEGLILVPESTAGSYTLKWYGKPGRTYFVQTSDALVAGTWSYASVIEIGVGGVLQWGLSTTTTQRLFVRLAYTESTFTGAAGAADFDGDGLTNSAELALHADPLNADSDGDGLPDGWEVAYGFNPLVADVNTTDTDADGLTLLMESLLNTNPYVAAVTDTANTAQLKVYSSGF